MLFQFHKGTIKTGIKPGTTITFIQFQFHKGTIKTKQRPDAWFRHARISIP